MGGVLTMDILVVVLIAAAVVFFVVAETFHIVEATRLRKARKRYLKMIEIENRRYISSRTPVTPRHMADPFTKP